MYEYRMNYITYYIVSSYYIYYTISSGRFEDYEKKNNKQLLLPKVKHQIIKNIMLTVLFLSMKSLTNTNYYKRILFIIIII